MKLEKIPFLLLLVTVVFLAGCAKQETMTGAGVAIEKFTPQISTVASNSPVEFMLIVKNTGEMEATDVKAVLGGLTFLINGDLPDEEQYNYWRSENWKPGNEIAFTDFLKDLDPPNLLGEDIESGFKGDQGIATWRLISPVQTRDQTYEPTINLVYAYSTVATILIKAVDFNYLQSLTEDKQKSIDTGVIVSKTSKGPIETSVKTDQSIVSGSSTLPIEIEFRNVGGGRTYLGEEEGNPQELYKIITSGRDKILVELPSDVQCNLKSDPITKKYEVRLVEGKTGRILCNKVIPPVSTTYTFSTDVKAEYRYWIEGKTTVKVSKTVYEPPIVDISLEDSTVTIEHDHSNGDTKAMLDLKIKNVGNQPISGTDVKVNYDVKGEKGILVVLPSRKSLGKFETILAQESKPLSGISKDTIISYTLQTEPPKLLKSSTIPVDELNDENNQKSGNIPLDYDISVESIEESSVNPSDFSFEIKATVKNKGTNVIGRAIPVIVVVVGDQNKESKVCDFIIDKLGVGVEGSTWTSLACPVENKAKETKFDISVSIEGSPLEKDFGLEKHNNILKKTFEIKYDVAVLNSGAVFLNKYDAGVPVYKLFTTVKNVGSLPVKGADLTVTFINTKDDSQLPVTSCTPLKDLSRQNDEVKVTCEYKTAEEKTLAKAKVTSKLKDVNEANNIDKEQFEISINYNIAILKGSSKAEFKEVSKATYKLSTEVKNIGTVVAENIEVKFVKRIKDGIEDCYGSATPICSVTEKFNLDPGITTLKYCVTPPISDTLNVWACAIGLTIEKDRNDNFEDLTIIPDYDLELLSAEFKIMSVDEKNNKLTYQLKGTVRNNAQKESASNVKVTFYQETSKTTIGCSYTIPSLSPKSTDARECLFESPLGKAYNAIAEVTSDEIKLDLIKNNEKTLSLPAISFGTTIVSPNDLTWQGTDKITLEVQDLGVTDADCKVNVQDENIITYDKSRTCSKNVIIQLKDTCTQNGDIACCSVEGERKCKITLSSKSAVKEFTASRTFHIDRKPPTITSFTIKDYSSGSGDITDSRIVAISTAAKDESTSIVRNTASGVDTCRFTEQIKIFNLDTISSMIFKGIEIPAGGVKAITIKQGDWVSCNTKFLNFAVYIDEDVFNYWKTDYLVGFNNGRLTSIIIAEVRDKAGNIANVGDEIYVEAPPEVVLVKDISSGIQGGYCGGFTIENNQLKTPSCKFDKVIVQENKIGNQVVGGKIPVKFKTDKPTSCRIIDTIITTPSFSSSCRTQFGLSIEPFSSTGYEISCDVLVPLPTRDVPQPFTNLYISECEDQFGIKTPLAEAYSVQVTLKDLLPPLTKILSVGGTSIPPVIVTASAISGTAPLNDVVIKADVSGTVSGNVYKLDCTDDGTFEETTTTTLIDPYTFATKCDYESAGTYTVRVTVIQKGVSISGTETIIVTALEPGKTITPIPSSPPKVTLASSQTAKIVVSGDEAMTCRWYEGTEPKPYSDTLGTLCDGSETTSATCRTSVSSDNGFFVRGKEYSMCVTCKDKEDNKQTSAEAQCVKFVVKDFP